MVAEQIRELLLARYALRVGPQMGEHVSMQLVGGAGMPVQVIGGDARTGVPVRRVVVPAHLLAASAAADARLSV